MRSANFVAAVAFVCVPAAWADTRDAEVITTVLDHFAARTDSMSLHESGVTLIRPTTGNWSAELLRGFSLDRLTGQCEISLELYDRFVVRNSSSIPIKPLLLKSAKWRIALPSEENKDPRSLGFLDKTPDDKPIKTLARISQPAFSLSDDSALIMFFFKWSMHSAVAQYVVERAEKGWSVKCSQLRFYP